MYKNFQREKAFPDKFSVIRLHNSPQVMKNCRKGQQQNIFLTCNDLWCGLDVCVYGTDDADDLCNADIYGKTEGKRDKIGSKSAWRKGYAS